ncbi:MAG: AIPR family protein, partial [Candidatus Sulfotelmatobacter sp.]
IEKLFRGKINLGDIDSPNCDPKNLDNFFLTRGLAAYAIHYLAQASVDDSASAVTDGGDDNGIDAVHYDPVEKRLYIVQSKWIHSGTGEPENGEVKKFIAGIKDLFDLSFERFNKKINDKKESITAALTDPATKYEVVLAYTGINSLAEPSSRDFQDLSDEMNDASEVLFVTILNQSPLYSSLTAGISGEPIALDIGMKSWGRIDSPHMGFYGQVDGAQISSWWAKYRTRLFTKNLRSVLGDTEVNAEIRTTIDENPTAFWYFNNGVTIISKKVTKTMVGGADTAFGTFHCEDASIVNGAQTVGTIGKHGAADKVSKILVPVRVISLEHGSATFGEDVTKTNNRQNRIENRDFVSLDPEQSRIRTELAIDKVDYQLARSESVMRGAAAFDLIESTTALACASGNVTLAVQLKREIGKLWEDLKRSPYKELFNASVSGMYVWRCVQTQRKIDKGLSMVIIQQHLFAGKGYGVAVHGNRIIAALVFSNLGAKQFANPQFALDGYVTEERVYADVEKYFTKLKDATRKALSKCDHPDALQEPEQVQAPLYRRRLKIYLVAGGPTSGCPISRVLRKKREKLPLH